MKLSAFLFIGMAQSALSMSIRPRLFGDGSEAIIGAIDTVKDAAASLDDTIQAINSSDLTALLALNSGSAAIVTTIQQQTAVVEGAADISLLSALPVQLAATGLIATLEKTLHDLEDKESFIAAAGVSSLVVTALQNQKAAGDGFSAALTEKVPSLVSFLANIDGNIIDQAFDKAIATFSDSSTTTSKMMKR